MGQNSRIWNPGASREDAHPKQGRLPEISILVDSPIEEGWKFEDERMMEKARKLWVEERMYKKQPKRKKTKRVKRNWDK